MPHPAITYRIFFGYIPNLKDCRFQRTYIIDNRIVDRTYSIKSYSQAYHIKLCTGETFNTGSIADMTQNLVREGFLQFLRTFLEQLNLLTGKEVELRRITSHKMREHRPGNNCILTFQTANQQRNFINGKS